MHAARLLAVLAAASGACNPVAPQPSRAAWQAEREAHDAGPGFVIPYAEHGEETVRGPLAQAARACFAQQQASNRWTGDVASNFVVLVGPDGRALDVHVTTGPLLHDPCLEEAARGLTYGAAIGGPRAIVSGAFVFQTPADGGADPIPAALVGADAGASSDAGGGHLAGNAESTVRGALAPAVSACFDLFVATNLPDRFVDHTDRVIITVGADGYAVLVRTEGNAFVCACVAGTARALNYGSVAGGGTATVSASFSFVGQK